MASCVYFGFVFAEKLRRMVETLWSRFEARKGAAREVFPTPESPVTRMGFLIYKSSSKICLYLSVSMVGTMIS